jgi:hypothetical protein
MEGNQTLCQFEHPGFAALGRPTFRLTQDDRVAALTLSIDNLDVVVPLRAVAQLFNIRPDSRDGAMLHLVEQGLRFVQSLQIGDRLPTEVVTGEASWETRPYHRRTAIAKLQLQLVSWIGGASDIDDKHVASQMFVVAADDPSIRPRVEESLRRAAAELGVQGGGEAVAKLIEDAAGELSYFEALREWLLDRVCAMTKRLVRIMQETSMLAPGRRETLVQVIRLATMGLTELGQQFDVVASQTTDTIVMLQTMERQRGFLRPHRDRLYTTLLEWEPILKAWDTLPNKQPKEVEGVWKVIEESYRFLAPRYMSVQHWQTITAVPERTERSKSSLLW